RTTYLNNECDDGFTISAATIELENGFSFDIVNMHPNSINENCRTETILKAFEDTGYSKIINSKYILVAGDFNLDPWRQNGKSVAAWKQIFNKGWSSKNFIYHNPFSSDSLPIKILYIPLRRTYDYVLSNFCEGVLDVLGETRNTKRLDGGS